MNKHGYKRTKPTLGGQRGASIRVLGIGNL